jgi:deazaflavin-dependent oxidoreductase (nitroreductase family)
VPLKLSRRLARFNKAYTNPFQAHYAWLLAPWLIVCHRGRKSGRRYRTPVIAFRRGHRIAIVVMYGLESDWVQNVLAGPAQVVRAGRTYPLVSPRLVDPEEAGLPVQARLVGRATGHVLSAELGPAEPGFGHGPAAA